MDGYLTKRHTDAVFGVGRWQTLLWNQREQSQAVNRLAGGLYQRTGPVKDTAAESRRCLDLADAFGREVFARLYDGSAERLDAPAAGADLLVKCHDMVADLPEWEQLRTQVHGDPDLAAVATGTLIDVVYSQLGRLTAEEKRKAQQDGREQTRRRQRGPEADPDGVLRRALRQACADAQSAAAEVKSGLAGIGIGYQDSPPIHEQDGSERMKLANVLANNPRMNKVMKLAGRLRRVADNGRKYRDDQGCDTIVGITIGGDLARVLPTELGLMRHKRIRRLQLAKLADRRMFQYDIVGNTPKGRGPVVVLVDESTSMMGERSLWANAIALACMSIAAREGRACTVIGFNHGVRSITRLDASGRSWSVEGGVSTPLGGAGSMAVKVATSTPHGGTRFGPAFQAALDLEDGITTERADLILVTDGMAKISDEHLDRVLAAREGGLRVFGLTIGGGSLSQAVRQVCDTTVDLDQAIKSNEAGEVAGAIP